MPLWMSLWQVTLAGSDFDTLLAVYTGTAVSALTHVASNDNCASGEVTSCATFDVTAGTTYLVQVDGAGGAKGAVSIGVMFVTVPAPPNDLFSNAVTTFPATGSTLGATLETGEPSVGVGASGSVWHRLTAPVASTSATVIVDATKTYHALSDCRCAKWLVLASVVPYVILGDR
jgi:hypothetical protein